MTKHENAQIGDVVYDDGVWLDVLGDESMFQYPAKPITVRMMKKAPQ